MFSDASIPAHTAETVRRLAARRRLPQSMLLTGGSARLRERCGGELAAALLCRAPVNGEACGRCSSCVKVRAGTHVDLIRIEPEKDRKTVSIKSVRERVLDQLVLAPHEAENKVFLFPEAQELSVQIQNALLKSIEEPPPFVCFLFLCVSRELLLPTVISRCTEFPLGDAGADASAKNAAAAAGIAVSVAEALCGGSACELLESTAPMAKNRELMQRAAEALIVLLRDAMAAEADTPSLSGAQRQALMLAQRFDTSVLLRFKAAMSRVIEDASHNANENLLLSEFSALLLAAASQKE